MLSVADCVRPLCAAAADELALRRAAFLTNGNARELRQYATGAPVQRLQAWHDLRFALGLCQQVAATPGSCASVPQVRRLQSLRRLAVRLALLSGQGPTTARCLPAARPYQKSPTSGLLTAILLRSSFVQPCTPRRTPLACPADTRRRRLCAARLSWRLSKCAHLCAVPPSWPRSERRVCFSKLMAACLEGSSAGSSAGMSRRPRRLHIRAERCCRRLLVWSIACLKRPMWCTWHVQCCRRCNQA